MPSGNKNRELKLFYWDDLLFRRTSTVPGAAIALASSKEQAIELVVDDARDMEGMRDEQLSALRIELISKRAHIHYKPVGFLRAP